MNSTETESKAIGVLQLLPPWVRARLTNPKPLFHLLLLLLPLPQVVGIMAGQPSIQGTRAGISTHQKQWIRIRQPWEINGGTPSGSTANGTLTLGAPPFSPELPSLPSVGSSRAKTLYPPFTPTPILLTRKRRSLPNPNDATFLLFSCCSVRPFLWVSSFPPLWYSSFFIVRYFLYFWGGGGWCWF